MEGSMRVINRDEYGYPTQPSSRNRIRSLFITLSKRILLLGINIIIALLGVYLQSRQKGQDHSPLRPQTFHPRRILLVRVDLIGDLVLSLTALRVLKRAYPDAEIDVLALPSSAQVITADPAIAQIITYDPNIWRRPRALVRKSNWSALFALHHRLRTRHYDLAISLLGPWAALLTVLSGAPRRVGFGQESNPALLTDSVAGRHWDEHDHQHEVDYCLQLAQAAGATIQKDDRVPHLYVGEQARQDIDDLLRQEDIDLAKPIIACHVSSNNGQSKRWPIPYWSRLLDRLIQEQKYTVVLTGAPADQPLITAITQRMHEKPFNLAGKTSLAQLAALLQRANLLITGDSGPMHIATAVDTPLIAIHGPTDPVMSGPISPFATVLHSDIWCRPCYTARGGPADCRFFTTQCMKDITPEQVFTVAQQKLHVQQTTEYKTAESNI
jgi:lipopolysaccharide heptosyltransferase II